MFEVRQTDVFAAWFGALKGRPEQAIIARRIVRVESGNLGDVKPVGDGVSELRIDYGQGFRVYFTRQGQTIVLLLCGGDKSSQRRDIVRARQMVKEI